MCVVYGLNYLDKTTLSYASIMGITLPPEEGGIGLAGDQYSWLASMFYFGYLAWEYPTNRLLQRLPLSKYSGFNIIMWGTVLSCFAGVSSFSGAVAVRFFLGLFESAVTPGFALFTSQWYTKAEQGTRTGIWFCFNGMGQVCFKCWRCVLRLRPVQADSSSLRNRYLEASLHTESPREPKNMAPRLRRGRSSSL